MSDLYCSGCGVPCGAAHFPHCPYRDSTASPMVSGEQLRAKKTYANYPPKYELQCAACAVKDTEIELLRSRLSDEQRESDRLRGIKKTLSLQAAGLQTELSAAKRRIEELENALPRWMYNKETGVLSVSTEGKFITTDQIDKAWANWVENKELRPYSRKGAELALKELGIVRCELCKEDRDNMAWGEGGILCSRCNGHGWVKGADDETR